MTQPSALVKKYVIEEGTDEVKALLKKEDIIITSKLTFAEVCASFARKLKEGNIGKSASSYLFPPSLK